MSDYYPDGVTDAHTHFNPPAEVDMVCGADEAVVVPSFAVAAELRELQEYAENMNRSRGTDPVLVQVSVMVKAILERIDDLEQDSAYECLFGGVMLYEDDDTVICPVCGRTHDTSPDEPEYDPESEL